MSPGAVLFIGFLIVQRLAELVLAQRNTARLMAQGAREVGAGHYPLIVAMHVLWLGAIAVLGHGAAIVPGWLVAFAVLQVLRVWIIASLGARWTTRIIVLDTPLVARGPYKYLKHPNYVLVVAEIAVAPLVLGLWQVALVFTVLNAAALTIRIRAEDRALRPSG